MDDLLDGPGPDGPEDLDAAGVVVGLDNELFAGRPSGAFVAIVKVVTDVDDGEQWSGGILAWDGRTEGGRATVRVGL